MSKLFKIVKDNATSLRSKSVEVSEITPEIISLVNDMAEYLKLSQDTSFREKHHLREGVGLAAPQIGKNIRALVVYFEEENEDGSIRVIDHRLINPKIISESVKKVYLSGGEGCLSVDDEHKGYVYRNYKILVKAYEVSQGKEVVITARGYEAIVLQHEIDHLNGVLFYDHIDKKDPFKVLPDSIRL